ncbi:MAG: DNA-protecting protein DprA [Bacteroidales bacterium]|nr:DNA-protecting protein DprA [Bacteroidales bacterium]
MESDLAVYACALSKVFAYKCAAGRRLMEVFGGTAGVFNASRDELAAVLRGGDGFVSQLLDPALLEWARQEVAWAGSHGVRLLTLGCPGYPRRLADCDDAPLLLYDSGTADLNAERVLAVVGTRKATWHGREACRSLLGALHDLNPKPLIVSGLALGIDGCAHGAALENGLETVGVLPCGPDEIYPHQHRELALRMLEHGALVTDFARGTAPVAFTFLRRNRIIAGLADATLLVESYSKGGGLITVSLANSYNRETFAVPGRISDASFAGCNRLLSRQEATAVADTGTIPLALGWMPALRGSVRQQLFRPGDPPRRREALRLLQERAPLTADDLAALMQIEGHEASVLLLELEMEGRAIADGSKFFLTL